MQFAVPQFIDSEDKIIGALTLKQFGILFGTGLIDVVIFKILGLGIAFYVVGVIFALVGVIFAFAPFNGRQLYDNVPLVIKFVTQPRVYIFKHEAPSLDSLSLNTTQKDDKKVEAPELQNLESSQSKLKKLSLLLDQQQQKETDLINRNYYGNQN